LTDYSVIAAKKWESSMTERQMRFDDGAGYERYMGNWSQRVGIIFLDWLATSKNLKWIDVGCGNGAFTELVVDRCVPAEVHGVDPSEDQLAFARTRPAGSLAKFGLGDAMALPFPADTFDVAVMALVIFFVPDPKKGVAEMARVVRPGGTIAAYAWDMFGGGFPLEPIRIEMRGMGITPVNPPSVDACRIAVMRELWAAAGLEAVQTREITVQRTFADFEDFWTTGMLGTSIRPVIAAMSAADVESLKARVRARLPSDVAGRITYEARANAVKARVPR
jgi:ubiquinone/menaquinone biosynthesis C-methylase UbiE